MTEHHYDLVIIGAGLSGVGVACHFTTTFPGKKYLVLESRKNLGVLGTFSNILEFALIQTCTHWGIALDHGKREKQ